MAIPGDRYTFDEERHEHRLDGQIIPGVTSILRVAGFSDNGHHDEQAMNRGTLVHRATHYLDEGDLNIETVDPSIMPYIEAYLKFKSEGDVEHYIAEQPICHDTLRYAGVLDRYGWAFNAACLWDIKTGAYQSWHPIQLEAYYRLLMENREAFALQDADLPRKRFVVELRADGTYRVTNPKITDTHAAALWQSALNLYRFKEAA